MAIFKLIWQHPERRSAEYPVYASSMNNAEHPGFHNDWYPVIFNGMPSILCTPQHMPSKLYHTCVWASLSCPVLAYMHTISITRMPPHILYIPCCGMGRIIYKDTMTARLWYGVGVWHLPLPYFFLQGKCQPHTTIISQCIATPYHTHCHTPKSTLLAKWCGRGAGCYGVITSCTTTTPSVLNWH